MRLAPGRLSRMRVIVPPQVMALTMSRLPAVPADGIRLRVLDPG